MSCSLFQSHVTRQCEPSLAAQALVNPVCYAKHPALVPPRSKSRSAQICTREETTRQLSHALTYKSNLHVRSQVDAALSPTFIVDRLRNRYWALRF